MPTENERFDGMLKKRDKQEKQGNVKGVERLNGKIPTHAAARADRRERNLVPWIKVGVIVAIIAAIAGIAALCR